MGIYEVGIAIRDDLRTNIDDPIKRDGQWIHKDSLNNLGGVGKTPAIFIEKTPGTRYVRSIGSGSPAKFPRYQIHVVIRNTDKGSIDGVNITSSDALMDKLVQLISDRLETASITISPSYIAMLQELESGGIWDLDVNTKVTTMEYEVQQV